ncbi:serine/threonine-protein phosphatase 6 regulatory subunit [Trifolium repens]|nr:serine/threonine-protein phosphatase 6 regulatory subunit [Trifolium repens]
MSSLPSSPNHKHTHQQESQNLLIQRIHEVALRYDPDWRKVYPLSSKERPEEECQVFNDKFICKDQKTLCDLGTAAISLGLNHLVDMTLEELDRQTIGLNSKQVSKILLKDVERPEDVRPIDDLLQYINAKDRDTKEEDTTRKKKKKKNRRKKLEKANDGDGSLECNHDHDNDFEDLDPLIMEKIDSEQYLRLENGRSQVRNIGHITQIANKLIRLAHNQSHLPARLQVSFLYIHGTREVEELERRLTISWEERKREMM